MYRFVDVSACLCSGGDPGPAGEWVRTSRGPCGGFPWGPLGDGVWRRLGQEGWRCGLQDAGLQRSGGSPWDRALWARYSWEPPKRNRTVHTNGSKTEKFLFVSERSSLSPVILVWSSQPDGASDHVDDADSAFSSLKDKNVPLKLSTVISKTTRVSFTYLFFWGCSFFSLHLLALHAGLCRHGLYLFFRWTAGAADLVLQDLCHIQALLSVYLHVEQLLSVCKTVLKHSNTKTPKAEDERGFFL